MPRILRSLTGLFAFLLIWEGAVRVGAVRQVFLPPPSIVLTKTVSLLGDEAFLRDVIATVLAWAIAMLIAVGIAVPAGMLLGSVRLLRDATRAIVEFLRPIPSVALVPLAILLVGSGPESKIVLAVYAAIWPILFNTIYALAEMDPLLLETARACGTGKFGFVRSVALPHAAPFVFTGFRLAVATGLILVVSTEFLAGADLGIGNFILEASSGGGRRDLVLAGTVVAGLVGYLVNEGLERTARRLFHWSPQEAPV